MLISKVLKYVQSPKLNVFDLPSCFGRQETVEPFLPVMKSLCKFGLFAQRFSICLSICPVQRDGKGCLLNLNVYGAFMTQVFQKSSYPVSSK